MSRHDLQKAFCEWIEFDKKNPRTRIPPEQEVIVEIRTPYKDYLGEDFFYRPKAIKISPTRLRNLCVPTGRPGMYIDVCRVLRWKYAE